jgi:Outer membrane protein beta-barrel domain
LRPTLLLLTIGILIAAPDAVAQQTDGPYLVGAAGGIFGDGNTTGSFSAGVGYLTPRSIGFEVELAWSPSILETPELPAIPTPLFPTDIAGFSPPDLRVRSRLLTLQTNVVGVLPGSSDRLRAFVDAGGGVADLHRRVHIRRSIPVLPPDLFTNPLTPALTFTTIERDVSSSESALVLGAGGGFDYALGAHMAVGTHVRYEHVFTSGEGLDEARIEARLRWMF